MRVLSIDGGGIRGIVPAIVLAEVERRTGRRVAELFDLIAGTSTGGILACALARPDPLSAEELVGLYERDGPRIFHSSLLREVLSVGGLADERYGDAALLDALRDHLGTVRLREVTVPIFVTAYEITDRFAFFFRSQRAVSDPTYDFSLVEVARATSAAPTYFEPYQVTDAAGARTYSLIDGGIYGVNPAMCAFADHPGEIDLMLSLGTGSHTRAYEFHKARSWGQLQWARPLIDMVFDGVADTVEFQLARLLGPGGYVRLQTPLIAGRDAMDDASPENLRALRVDADRLLRESERDLDRVCEALAA